MTSELRPAVETRAEVLDQLLSELQDGNAWDSTISLLADYADLVQDLLKDRKAVRAEQAAELAKFKALTRRMTEAVREIKDSWDWWQVDTYDRCPSVVEYAINEALREYKEARDV